MAKQTTSKPVSLGICTFCQGEFPKNKFTQHLKTCKARQERSAAQEGESQRLFHLQVEGKYRPEYWMHLELPATATLADLDSFLRYVWLECCDHLSEFTIKGESYEYEMMDPWGLEDLTLVEEPGTPGDDEDDLDEEDDEDEEEFSMEEIATEMSRQLALEFQTDLKNVPVGEIEKKLEALFAENMPPGLAGGALPMLRPLLTTMAESLQQGTLAQDLAEMEEEEEEEEEGGMRSELGDVLEVGDKFSYVYDFGSSSTLSLRVLAEREGAVPVSEDEEEEEHDHDHGHAGHGHEEEDDEDFEDEEDEEEMPILIMARNEAPKLTCHICGKPATQVPSLSEYTSLASVALCDTHAKKAEDADMLLPIVNSPRTGICGYDGDNEEEWDFEDEDEEE